MSNENDFRGYIGDIKENIFYRIETDQINIEKINLDWTIFINIIKPIKNIIVIKTTKEDNYIKVVDISLKKKTIETKNLFFTLMSYNSASKSFMVLFDGYITRFQKRHLELPPRLKLTVDDFTGGITDSMKKAQRNISERLGGESFDLIIESFEIKTPYIVDFENNKKMVMKRLQPSEIPISQELPYSKMSFKKTPKILDRDNKEKRLL